LVVVPRDLGKASECFEYGQTGKNIVTQAAASHGSCVGDPRARHDGQLLRLMAGGSVVLDHAVPFMARAAE
jgi:hypothetical protein